MLIICIKGTNGSGKSTIVRKLLEQGYAKPIYGLLGARRPEAYLLTLPDVDGPVYVLGSYHTESGGADQIQPYDLILDLIKKYAAKGHVLFEGVIVSSSYGRVGRLMETYGPKNAVMAFLNTTLEECLANVQKRRDTRVQSRRYARKGDKKQLDPKNTTGKFNQIKGSRETILAKGKLRVVDINWRKGAEEILALLQEG